MGSVALGYHATLQATQLVSVLCLPQPPGLGSGVTQAQVGLTNGSASYTHAMFMYC